MSSILAICQSPAAMAAVERTAAECSGRVRTVSTFNDAAHWITMQSFEVIVIEEGLDHHQTIKFLEAAWKANPLTEGAVFNFKSEVANPWEAMLIGARVFSGPASLRAFKDLLQGLSGSMPKSFLEQLTVLVVDDLDAPRDILCSYIQNLGYPQASGVPSAEQALNELRRNASRYFCVLTDIAMPFISGISLLQQIRASKELSQLPVIICTANPTSENLARCIYEGASGFIVKPPKKVLLLAELDKAKRIFRTGKNPRLCPAELSPKFEEAMRRRGLI